MKNILAAIMLMGATVSVEAMTIEKVKASTNQLEVKLREQFAKLSRMSNQDSYRRTYIELERTMLGDAERLCTLATQWRNGDIEEAEEIKRQGQEYTQRLVNSYYDCRDHLRSWQADLESHPSFIDAFLSLFVGRSRAAEITSNVIDNLKKIADDALNLRRNLPGGESTSDDIAEAKNARDARRNAPHNAAAEQE